MLRRFPVGARYPNMKPNPDPPKYPRLYPQPEMTVIGSGLFQNCPSEYAFLKTFNMCSGSRGGGPRRLRNSSLLTG